MAEVMQPNTAKAGAAPTDTSEAGSTNHDPKAKLEASIGNNTSGHTPESPASVPSVSSPPASSTSSGAQSSPICFLAKTEIRPGDATLGSDAEPPKSGTDDASERWSTATSLSLHTVGPDSEASPAENCLLTDNATHGLKVIVSPTGFTIEKSEPNSSDFCELSLRTVRFKPGDRKRIDGAAPADGSRTVGFCRGHGLCALCTLVAALPAVLTVVYVLNLWASEDVRWRSFCQEYDDAACLTAMKSLQGLLSPTVAPCDNMHAYVCDQWHHGPDTEARGITLVDSAKEKFFETVNRELLNGQPLRPNVFGRHVLQRLYASCNASLHEATAKSSPLKAPTELAPILMAGRIDVLMRAVLDTTLRWGLEMLLGTSVERNGSSGSYVHVYAGRSLAEKMEGSSKGLSVDGKRYLKHVVDSIGNPRFTAAVVGSVMSLDEEVREALCCAGKHLTGLVPLWNLGTTTTRVNTYIWLDFLVQHHWLGEPHEGISTMLRVTGLSHIKGAHSALKQHTDVVVQLYMYLLASLEVLQYDYRKHVYQTSKTGSGVIHACMEATRRVLSPSWPYVIADISGHAHLTVAVGDMYEKLSQLTADNPYSGSMDNSTRFRAASQISALTLDAFPAFLPVKDVNIINFDSSFVLGGNFSSDFLHLLKASQVLARDSGARLALDRLAEDQARATMEFSPLTRSLVVPTAYTIPPLFYEEDLPESFNYGTLGVLIAKEMSEAVAPGSPLLIPDATLEAPGEWWTEASRRSLNKTVQCWQRQLNPTEPNGSIATAEPGLERTLFVWSRALRIAFDALRGLIERRALRRTRDVRAAQEHWMLQQRVFFARFCLLACSSAGVTLEGGTLARGRRCTLPLINMREFRSAHNCTARNETSFCHEL